MQIQVEIQGVLFVIFLKIKENSKTRKKYFGFFLKIKNKLLISLNQKI